MIRKQYGVSLVEMMVSVSLVAIVFTITVGLFMQAGKVFSRTSVRIEPQRSLTLAIKKMEGDMREAMFVRIGSNSTMVELGMPLLDENGMIAMSNITRPHRFHANCLAVFLGYFACDSSLRPLLFRALFSAVCLRQKV